MLEKIIKKEVKHKEEEEEEETDEETDEEEGEEELEEEDEGSKVLSVEEEWKLRHTEQGKTEPVEKLGKTLSICYWFVVTLTSSLYTYLYSKLKWLIGLC